MNWPAITICSFIAGLILGGLMIMSVYDDRIERGFVVARGHLYHVELVK